MGFVPFAYIGMYLFFCIADGSHPSLIHSFEITSVNVEGVVQVKEISSFPKWCWAVSVFQAKGYVGHRVISVVWD